MQFRRSKKTDEEAVTGSTATSTATSGELPVVPANGEVARQEEEKEEEEETPQMNVVVTIVSME